MGKYSFVVNNQYDFIRQKYNKLHKNTKKTDFSYANIIHLRYSL